MRSLLSAALLALGFHALLFSFDLGRAREESNPPTPPELITITLEQAQIPAPVIEQHSSESILPKPEPAAAPKKMIEKKSPGPKPRKKVSVLQAQGHRRLERERPDRLAAKDLSAVQERSAVQASLGEAEHSEAATPVPPNPILPTHDGGQSLAPIPAAPAAIREAIPVYRTNPSPEYPAIARRRGYEGTVLVEALVSREGRVQDLRLSQSSGYSVLDRAAMASIKGWLFEPAAINEEKVEMWVKVPIRFHLK